jgi:hypothetical protein
MFFLYPRSAFILMGSILLFPANGVSSCLSLNGNHTEKVFSDSSVYQAKKGRSEGYTAITRYEDVFIAAGSDGRIDIISSSGTVIKSEKFPGEKFNSILSFNKMVIAAGDNGTLMISNDRGLFRKADIGTIKNINSLTLFNGIIISGADHGEIITGDGTGFFKKTDLPLKGNIVSVSARSSECFGVTDEGEIIHSVDGIKWDITDFNKVYSGYYKPCYFTKVLVTDNRIAVAGIRNDRSPVLMFSNQGNVWTERTLDYTDDQGIREMLEDLPYDMIYDDSGDLFYMVCSKGKVLQLPSCSHCNKLAVIATADLEGISSNDNIMMIVGENFLIKTISLKW